MRHKFLVTIFLFPILLLQSQETHTLNFKYIYAQEGLTAHAGEDKVILPGDLVTLGGEVLASGGLGPYYSSWYADDGGWVGDFSHQLKLDETASFVLLVSDARGCTSLDTITIQVNQTTGAYARKDDGIMLYPNPATDRLFIQLPEPAGEGMFLSLFDSRSALVRRAEIESGLKKHILDLKGVPPGIYVLKTSSWAGFETRKIIVK